MIWKLKVECVKGINLKEDCVRILEVDSGASLKELHEAIQDAIEFDRKQHDTYFIGFEPRFFKGGEFSKITQPSEEGLRHICLYVNLTNYY